MHRLSLVATSGVYSSMLLITVASLVSHVGSRVLRLQ